MNFPDIYSVSHKGNPLGTQELIGLEKELGVRFFDDLRTFLTCNGPGVINDYIVIPTIDGFKEFFYNWPKVQDLSDWCWDNVEDKKIIDKHFFRFGSTVDNDGLYFCPDAPSHVFLFPRQDWHVEPFLANIPALFVQTLAHLEEEAHPLFFKAYGLERQKKCLIASGDIQDTLIPVSSFLKKENIRFSHRDEDAFHYFQKDFVLHIAVYPFEEERSLEVHIEIEKGHTDMLLQKAHKFLKGFGFFTSKRIG